MRRLTHGFLALSCIGCDGSVVMRGTLTGTSIQQPRVPLGQQGPGGPAEVPVLSVGVGLKDGGFDLAREGSPTYFLEPTKGGLVGGRRLTGAMLLPT